MNEPEITSTYTEGTKPSPDEESSQPLPEAVGSQSYPDAETSQALAKEELSEPPPATPYSAPPIEDSDVAYPRPRIIYRAGWGAVSEKHSTPLPERVSTVIFTYTGTNECSNIEECVHIVQWLQRRDMQDRHMPDIQYNFLVGGDGHIYEGRGWYKQPDVSLFHNEFKGKSLSIGYIGDFSVKDPTLDFVKCGAMILSEGILKECITRIIDLVPLRTNKAVVVDVLQDVAPKLEK